MPELTVIIATYNRANLLKDAIESVLSQSFQDFELIMVDDCSSDNTKDVVRKFQDKRIFYLRHQKNRGAAAAKNTGIRVAQGEYIISLDDDDLMAPWALAELIKRFRSGAQENLGGVYGWSWWVYNEGKTLKILDSQEKGNIFKAVFKDQVFTNILLKREIFDVVGLYDETLSSNEDYDLCLRLAKAYKIDFIPRVLFIIRVQQQKHLSQLSFSHMEIQQSVKQRYSQNTRSSGLLILKFFPITFYLKLSLFKHKVDTILKIIGNIRLRQEIAKIREELKSQGIRI